MRVLVFVEDAKYILKKKADRRLAGPLFLYLPLGKWSCLGRGMGCETNCKERSLQFVMLCLDELFELVSHGVDVGVRDNEGRQEAQRMGAGVVEHQALRRVEGG